MEYFLDEDQIALRDLARKVAKEKIAPVASKHDREGSFPHDLVKLFAELGLFGVCIPEEYGGMGKGIMELAIIIEELSRACAGISLTVAASALGTFPILLAGSPEQKKKYLPPLARGDMIAAFGLTEPHAGSDAASLSTTARRDGDYYILNGTKCFITNGGVAGVYTIIATVDKNRGARGCTAFIVDKETPGFSIGKYEDKMGIRAATNTELIFDDARVPVENRLGEEGEGFRIAMRTLDRARPGVAAQALGIAQGALDLALDYVKTRVQFGQTIASFQGIQFMLSDMATAVESSRALIYATARMIDAGVKNIARESAMCKLYASDVAMKVTTDAVQLFGGYGYMRDYPVEKLMRDAKITQIYEGTNQIQRIVIARSLIREGFI